MKKIIAILLFVSIGYQIKAQNTIQNSGWLIYVHTQKLSHKFGLGFDFQLRSADKFDYVKAFVFRPSINYFINEELSATAGFGHFINNQKINGHVNSKSQEEMVWEQFAINSKIHFITLTNRFRLEQRFIERANHAVFSERLRYALQLQIPLYQPKGEETDKGFFLYFQNEVFLHLQNKDQLNNHTFDQNRAYAALGYKFSPKLDLETGYLNQISENKTNYTFNHVVQVTLRTHLKNHHPLKKSP